MLDFLKQQKLIKSEWESLEIPCSTNEIRIIKIIHEGYENPSVVHNYAINMIRFTKMSPSDEMHYFLYVKYFQSMIEEMKRKYDIIFHPLQGKAIKKLKSGDHLITTTDRLGRNTINILSFIEKCKKSKIKVHLIDIGGDVCGGDIISTMFVRLLAVFNQFYADQLSEKQKATKQRMAKENRFLGGKARYGYDVNDQGKYEVCEKEMSVIRQMKLLKNQGHTYRSIASSISKSTNKKFDSGWIFRILKREGGELQCVA